MKTLTIVKHLCKNYSILHDCQPCGWRGWGDCRCSRQVSVDRLCTDAFTSVQTCLVLALLLTDRLISGSDNHAFGSLFLSPSDVWACSWLVARCYVLITLSFLLLSACSIWVFWASEAHDDCAFCPCDALIGEKTPDVMCYGRIMLIAHFNVIASHIL